MPLVLSRKPGESIRIGPNITVTIAHSPGGGRVAVEIDAPEEVRVLRGELEDDAKKENGNGGLAN